jgi:hypothetical protein
VQLLFLCKQQYDCKPKLTIIENEDKTQLFFIVLQQNQSQNKRILPATARDGGANPGVSIPDIDTNGQVLGNENFE